MQLPDLPRPLVIILGPTAVGKTELALRLAERTGGEIISADSRLLYRGMDIGTAKPTPKEQQRVPHHLIDMANPDETWSLALFKQAAQEAIDSVHSRGRLPFLVGGTGQYVRAISEDWTIPEQEPDFRLRKTLEAWAEQVSPQGLYDRLRLIDPEAAAHIEPSNVRRTIRALEVIFLTGKRFSEQRTKVGSPYSRLMIGLNRPRADLYARIDQRIDAMLAAGLLEEVRRLLNQGYTAELPTMSAIGYREMSAYLQDQMTLEDAVVQMKRLTRQFVRRQANWFKPTDANIYWFAADRVQVEELIQLIETPHAWLPPDRP